MHVYSVVRSLSHWKELSENLWSYYYCRTEIWSSFDPGVKIDQHKCTGRGGGGAAGLLPQNLGNLDFLGSKRNLGKTNF